MPDGALAGPWSKGVPEDDVDAHFEGAGHQYDVDPNLLRAMVQQESGGNRYARSDQGAEGMAQFLPSTAREMGITDTSSPRQSIYGMAKYVRQNMDKFGASDLAVAAYHGGPNTGNWGPRTADYVNRVGSIYAELGPSQRPTATDAQDSAPQAAPKPWERYAPSPQAAAPNQPAGTKPWEKYQPLGSRGRQPFALPSDPKLSKKQAYQRAVDEGATPALTEAGAPLPPMQHLGETPEPTLDPGTGLPIIVRPTVTQGAPPAEAPAQPQSVPIEQGNGAGLADVVASPEAAAADMPPGAQPTPAGTAQGPLGAVAAKAAEAFGTEPLGMSEQTADALRKAGILPVPGEGPQPLKQVNEAALRSLAAAWDVFARGGGAGFAAFQETLNQAGLQMGLPPQLARDIAASPEAFFGMPGNLHAERRAFELRNAHRSADMGAAGVAPTTAEAMPMLTRQAEEARARMAAPPPEPPVGSGASVASNIETARQTAQEIRETRGGVEAQQTPVPAAPDNIPALTVTAPRITPEQMAAAEEAPPPEPPAPPVPEVPRAPEPAPVPETPEPPAAEIPQNPPLFTEAEAPEVVPPGTAGNRRKPVTLYETVPKEPERLSSFIKRMGGVQDEGGDIRHSLGGSRFRPGLINKNGLPLDEMTQRAWTSGYMPDFAERPSINDLRDAIDDDVKGRARYSAHDDAAVAAYEDALAKNNEIDRLASQHDIPTTGITRDQFFDQLHEKLSVEEQARLIEEQAAAHETGYAAAQKAALDWHNHGEAAGDRVVPKDLYGQSQARTLKDLEDEHRQQAQAASAAQQRAEGAAEPRPAARGEGDVQEGGGPRGGGAGDDGRAAAEAPTPGEVIGAGDLWSVPPIELERMLAEKREGNHAKLVRALGSEAAAKEFIRIDRKQNSQDPRRADDGAREFDAKYGTLTPEQERLIYGIGETDAAEHDIRLVLDAHGARHPDPTDAAYEAASALRSVDPKDIRAVPAGGGTGSAQAAFVRLKNAYEDMLSAGVSSSDIPRHITEALVSRGGWRHEDAAEFVGVTLESLRRDAHSAPPTDLAGRALAQPAAPRLAPPGEPTIRNDARQDVMPGMGPSAKQAQAARDAQGRGALQTDVAQKPANEGLFAPDRGQGTLYAGPGAIFDPEAWKRFFTPIPKKELPPQKPPGGMFEPPKEPPKGPTLPPEVDAARIAVPSVTKNLNPVERLTIFPRVMASLDDMSARAWNAWKQRETAQAVLTDKLRSVIQPNFLKLDRAGRDRVAAALEMGRIAPEALDIRPDGIAVVRNTTVPFARWSKVGDVIELTPQESAGLYEAMKLGDEQWNMLMQGAAKRYGWDGEMNPARIREAAQEAKDDRGAGKKLTRLADLLDAMTASKQQIYFPMQRFGSHFISIRPKEGPDVAAAGGGRPPLVWFETVEKPGMQDILGKSGGRLSVQKAAADRIAELRKQFPADRYDVESGDFSRKPSLLRRIDIPAIDKLMMLMETSVQKDIRNRVMQEEGGPTTLKGVREEAKSRYQDLHGRTIEAFYDALFDELKAGYRKRANVVPGYSADFDRAIGTHLYQIARNTADMMHHDAIETAFNTIQDYHPHRTVADYWKRWRDYQDDPGNPLSRAANGTSQVGYAYTLGLSPSSLIIDTLMTPLASGPVLSLGVGPQHAIPALVRGLGNAYRSVRIGKDGLHMDLDVATRGMPKDKTDFMKRLASEGQLEAVGAHDLARLNERPILMLGDKSGAWRKAMQIATSTIGVTDQTNRLAAASAAWDIASDPKKLNAAAGPWMRNNSVFRDMVQNQGLTRENFTRFMISEAAFDWGRANRAPWMRSWYGTLASTLHGYQTRYLSTAFKLMKNMGPEGKAAAGLMMAALWSGAGIQGLPFVEDIENGANAIWKQFFGKNPATAFQLRDLAESAFGKAGASIALDGPASYLTGIDLGPRTGYGDVLSREFDTANIIGTIPSIVWQSVNGASQRYSAGQSPWAVASEALPFALRGAARAMATQDQGVLTRRGSEVMPKGAMTSTDLAKQAVGFTPMSLAIARRERERYREEQQAQPSIQALIKAGKDDEAVAEMARLGWSKFRIRQELRNAHREGPPPQMQFHRWLDNRQRQPEG